MTGPALIEATGLTTRQLVETLHVSPRTVRYWKTGSRIPGPARACLRLLAEKVDVGYVRERCRPVDA